MQQLHVKTPRDCISQAGHERLLNGTSSPPLQSVRTQHCGAAQTFLHFAPSLKMPLQPSTELTNGGRHGQLGDCPCELLRWLLSQRQRAVAVLCRLPRVEVLRSRCSRGPCMCRCRPDTPGRPLAAAHNRSNGPGPEKNRTGTSQCGLHTCLLL